MQMDAEFGYGRYVKVESMAILSTHTTALLHDELAQMGARMVVDYLKQLQSGQSPVATPQPEAGDVC